jgi:hypothetical protein
MSLIFIEQESNIIIDRHNSFIYKNEPLKDFIHLVNKNITQLVLIYKNNYTYDIPFFIQNYGTYFYFSDDLIELFQSIKKSSGLLKVNLISNNVHNNYFNNEIEIIEKKFGIKIDTDTELNTVLKELPIDNYDELEEIKIEEELTNNTELNTKINTVTLDQLLNYKQYFKIIKNNNGGYQCTLLENIELSTIGWKNANYYILLKDYDIFDGNNNVITVNWKNNGIFGSDINEKSKIPIIKNLIVESKRSISNGGAIVIDNTKFIQLENCISKGILVGSAGGICGSNICQNNGYCAIYNCQFNGKINGSYNGGICGPGAGIDKGNCDISGCNVIIDISGNYNGGICGSSVGKNGNCAIYNCQVNCKINGIRNGGITSFATAISGKCDINGCNVIANIIGSDNGGITANFTATDYGLCNITNCQFNGDINGNFNGCICGPNSSNNNGSLTVTNCNSKGIVKGKYNGGILAFNNYRKFISGKSSIINSYSTVNFNNNINTAISNGNKLLNIQNCYYDGFNVNIPLVYSINTDDSVIISNSYTTTDNLINTNKTNLLYIFNSYCKFKIINDNIASVYFNAFKPTTGSLLISPITPIVNKINTNSQVNNIGSKIINGYKFTPSKWDIVNTWNMPSASTTDNDTYPTLKTNP